MVFTNRSPFFLTGDQRLLLGVKTHSLYFDLTSVRHTGVR
jgi:hypothetical protein